MTVHICLLIYISVLGLFTFTKKPYSKKKNRRFVIAAFLGVFLVQSLRSVNVGLDTDQYTLMFEQAKIGYHFSEIERLFKVLIIVTAKLTNSPQWFYALCSFLILYGLGIFIVQNTEEGESAFWSVFLFITLTQYFSSMNLLRQSLAMAVGCNIYTVLSRGINRKRIILSICLLIISFMFHTTGVLLAALIVPFVIKVDKKIIILEFIAALSTYYLSSILLNLFVRVFPYYAYKYMSGNYSLVREASSSGYYYLIGVVELFMMVLCLFYIDPQNSNNTNCYRLLFIVLISFAFIVLQRKISFAMRMGYYFELFLILMIPYVISRWKQTASKNFLKVSVYFLGWAYFIYSMTLSNARGCVPYTFFWQV